MRRIQICIKIEWIGISNRISKYLSALVGDSVLIASVSRQLCPRIPKMFQLTLYLLNYIKIYVFVRPQCLVPNMAVER